MELPIYSFTLKSSLWARMSIISVDNSTSSTNWHYWNLKSFLSVLNVPSLVLVSLKMAVWFFEIVLGIPNFANETFANYWRKSRGCIGELSMDILAKIHWTFANWRISKGYIGELPATHRFIFEAVVKLLVISSLVVHIKHWMDSLRKFCD